MLVPLIASMCSNSSSLRACTGRRRPSAQLQRTVWPLATASTPPYLHGQAEQARLEFESTGGLLVGCLSAQSRSLLGWHATLEQFRLQPTLPSSSTPADALCEAHLHARRIAAVQLAVGHEPEGHKSAEADHGGGILDLYCHGQKRCTNGARRTGCSWESRGERRSSCVPMPCLLAPTHQGLPATHACKRLNRSTRAGCVHAGLVLCRATSPMITPSTICATSGVCVRGLILARKGGSSLQEGPGGKVWVTLEAWGGKVRGEDWVRMAEGSPSREHPAAELSGLQSRERHCKCMHAKAVACTHQSRAALMTMRLAEKRPTVSAVMMPINVATAMMYCIHFMPAAGGHTGRTGSNLPGTASQLPSHTVRSCATSSGWATGMPRRTLQVRKADCESYLRPVAGIEVGE